MKVIPRESFVVETDAPVKVVVERLSAHVQAPTLLSTYRKHKMFSGSASLDGFKIVRMTRFNTNAWRPVSIGRFEQTASGTRVHVDMRLRRGTAGAVVLWLGFMAMVFLLSLNAPSDAELLSVRRISAVIAVLLVAGIFFFWAWLIVNWSFRIEAKRARELITTVVEGRDEAEHANGEADDIT